MRKYLESITTYTAADDSRIEQFQRFAHFFRAFNSSENLKVIPFGEETTLIEEECKKWKFQLIQPNKSIDQCGKSIFKKIEYRPGVHAWRYMRKLNSFVDSEGPFVFLDVNNIVLCNVKQFDQILTSSGMDILFSGDSAPKRTINIKMKSFYEALDPKIGGGYNCSLILAKNNIFQERDFEFLCNPKMKKFFKKAPEQGYIAFLLSLSTIKHGSIIDNIRPTNFAIGRSLNKDLSLDNITIDPHNLEVRNLKDSKVILTFKATGTQLADIPRQINNLVNKASTQWLENQTDTTT